MIPNAAKRAARKLCTRRLDYVAPSARISHYDLNVLIKSDEEVEIQGTLSTTPQIRLDCDPSVEVLEINGMEHKRSEEEKNDGVLQFPLQADPFEIKIKARVNPKENKTCRGFYYTGGLLATQMEADGFRRMFPSVDRPDDLATYRVRIEADKTKYPILLSNGNLLESGSSFENNHHVVFEDPFKKPTYLFAMVAGDLNSVSDTFTTASGSKVKVNVYSTKKDVEFGQLDFALRSVLKAMKFDEDEFGLEYDLDTFNVVAVADFNMGAMENKGLNIFNTALLVGSTDTASDGSLNFIDRVVAHEYFHNWTGNRVTVRDWFQLTLKEGLTVFRDQTYTEKNGLFGALSRIDSALYLQTKQFRQDAGPRKHAIRPDDYYDPDVQLYTVTVYEKGAEVIRMYQTLLGDELFKKGLSLYLKDGDGKAMTCDDFLSAMERASGKDLTLFSHWYSTAGTPKIKQSGVANGSKYLVTFERDDALPDLHIPIKMALIDRTSGTIIAEKLVELKSRQCTEEFDNIPAGSDLVISSFRGMSAPVHVPEQSTAELLTIAEYETDTVKRFMSIRQLHHKALFDLLDEKKVDESYLNALHGLVERSEGQEGFIARALELPSVAELLQKKANDPLVVEEACGKFKDTIKSSLAEKLRALYDKMDAHATEETLDMPSACRRALSNRCLDLLGDRELSQKQFEKAQKYTLRLAAFGTLLKRQGQGPWVDTFKSLAGENPTIIDQWFSLQAANLPLEDVQALTQHPEFSYLKPNRVRSIYRAFEDNTQEIHRKDGAGYAFMCNGLHEVDKHNVTVACQLLDVFEPFQTWGSNTEIAIKELAKLKSAPDISSSLYQKLIDFIGDA